jgi:hypothetical protein
VYDLGTGASVASYDLGDPETSLINDVTVTKAGAWFTDSFQARLYFVPVSRAGVPGPSRTLALSGPAADTSGEFNLNGIQATANGKTLIVAHSTNGQLYTVDPRAGASATIAGVSVPQVDGIVLEGRRLWAVQNTNQVTRIRLGRHLTSGVVEKVITSPLFQVPTTAGLFGRRLAGGQRQVRHRHPTHRRPVRDRPGQGVIGHSNRRPVEGMGRRGAARQRSTAVNHGAQRTTERAARQR